MPVLAIGAVDLIAFIVALAAILMVFAAYAFFYPLVGLLNKVSLPFLSFGLGDVISSGLKLAMQGLISIYDAAAPDAAHFLYTIGMGMWHLVYNVTQGITKALGLANQAVSAAGSVAAQLPVDISGAISSANSYADGVLATAEADAAGLYNAAISHADVLYNRVEGDLFNDVAGLQNTIAADLTEALDHADGLYNQAIATAQDLATQAALDGIHEAQNVYNLVEGDLANVEDVLNGEISNIIGQVDALTGDIAGLATVATVAGLLTQVATISTEIDTCLEPLCDTVTPNAGKLGELGSLLNGIDGIVDAALLTGLLSAAVADPKAAASAVVSTGGWLSTLGVDAANAFGLVV